MLTPKSNSPDACAVFGRNLRVEPPVAVAGDGPYIIDSKGKRYLDASGGAAVSCLGHSDTEVVDAIKAQLDALPYAHTGFFTSEPAEALAAFLAAHAPGDLNHVYFVSGGSEATEAALKLARQYYVDKGEATRHRVIARRQSYHGNTLGALAVGGNAWRRAPFAPLLIETSHIPPAYAYREQEVGESESDYAIRAADALEAEILRLGPETVMAFIAEPVVGATLGAVPAPAGYFKRIREICDRYGVLLILDEVMCGMGRTGRLFAAEDEGIAADITTIAKGLGAGYQPVGAMIASTEIYQTVRDVSGAFQHGHTYIGHPTACAGALAVIQTIETNGLLSKVRADGATLTARLREQFQDHPHIGDIRGRGLFIGLEIVADRETKAPFDPARKTHAKIKAAAFENGLMVYPMGGTVDGNRGDHILLAPPFIYTAAHYDVLMDTLAMTIHEILGNEVVNL